MKVKGVMLWILMLGLTIFLNIIFFYTFHGWYWVWYHSLKGCLEKHRGY